ncbi:hypothetical protein HXX76_010373 [Chlamydomonas incerta]|uniref:Choline transporter-like protein n=1 Tax=Chlamydomonas incerta TaxID=51695 RepID=A0A835SUY5_CHLIN|nr:hypothetical protein HXX76_010373 [Chlamydomonas incerta]|eukprot:KAG2430278.1 hypothetical protein HXX76_010373 [Chlamydomonas incerta]
MAHGHGHDEPLLSAYHFNYSQRPPRDRAWGLAYSLLILLTVGWAAALVVLNPDIVSVLSCPSYLDDANNCPLKLSDPTAAESSSGGRLTVWMAQAREALAPATRRPAYQHLLLNDMDASSEGSSSSSSSSGTLRHLLGGEAAAAKPQDDSALPRVLLDYGGALLLLSLAAALVLTALFVAALRISPWALVLLACALQVGAPLASAMLAMQAGNHSLALVLLLVSAAIAVMLYVGRQSLALVSRLLGVSAVALGHNSVLLALVAGLKAALAGATVLMLVAAAVVGASGDVVPNPLRGGSPRCATPSGTAVACCALSAPPSLHAYAPASAIALAWTVLLLFELKVFVVSGVVAQWYFSPTSHLPGAAGIESGAALSSSGSSWWSGRALCASLGHALGPSFGSLCAASAILGSTAYARAVVNRILYRGRSDGLGHYAQPGCCGISCCLAAAAAALGCCCWCAVALLEQISKFATVQMAMSGLGFWRSSSAVVDLLRRNFMDAYNMWWYLPMVLHSGGAAFAAAWGYTIYFVASNSWTWPAFMGHVPPLTHAAAAALAGLAGGVAALVLVFVCSVLVNIADALFICFVLDKDSSAVTWYELHRVCAQLPCCVAATAAAADPHAAHHHPGSPYYYPGAQPATHAPGAYGYQSVPVAPGAVVGGQLGHPINPYSTRYGSYGTVRQPQPAGGQYGGFWGWLRSPSGSAGGFLYGIPGGRADRPQYPPPAILSPPYSDQRFPMGPRPPLPPVAPAAPPPQQPYYPPMGSPHRPA